MEDEHALTDIHRILMGDAPWIFVIELVIRTLIVYFLLLFFMRLMGKQVASEMSCSELAVILMLGAIVGLPIQSPDRGLLPAVLVLLVVLVLERGLAYWSFRSRKVEVISHGDLIILLKDGVLLPEALKESLLSPAKIFAALRSKRIEHLGQLKRAYLETTGNISIIRYRSPRAGLLIVPELDIKHDGYEKVSGQYACGFCGNLHPSEERPEVQCRCCGRTTWSAAVIETRSA